MQQELTSRPPPGTADAGWENNSSSSCDDVEQPMAMASGSGGGDSMALEEALHLADAGGIHHRRVCGAVLLATFCGGMAGGVSPFLLTPVKEEIQLTALQNSLFASSTFIGMWAGSFLGGVASDACGPGRVMVAALGTLLLGGVAPSLLASATAIVVARIVVGAGIVVCYQAGNTYVAESAPASHRAWYMSLLHVTIAIGGIACTGLAVAVPPARWRLLLALNCVPTALAMVLLYPFVRWNESPRWLLVTGRERECRAMLHRILMATRRAGKLARSDASLPGRLALNIETTARGGGGGGGGGGGSGGGGGGGGDGASGGLMRGNRSSTRRRAAAPAIATATAAAIGSSGATASGTGSGGGDACGGGIDPAADATTSSSDAAGTVATTSPEKQPQQQPSQQQPSTQASSSSSSAAAFVGGSGWRARLKQLCHGSLWRLHLVGSSTVFALNFGQKGLEIWSGVYVERLGHASISRSIYFTMLAGKVAGDVVNMVAAERFGRE